MQSIAVYSRIYALCFSKAMRGIGKSPWTLLLPIAMWTALLLLGSLFGHLGFIGGMLWGLAMDALLSGYLYFVGEIVRDTKVSIHEIKTSLGAYFWAVLNVIFVIWLVEFLLDLALQKNPHALTIQLMARFLAFVLLNAVPEVIYQRHTYGGVATVQQSIAFIHSNWIEWFIPNLAFGALYYFGLPYLGQHNVPAIVQIVISGALLHFVMVFRGHLFSELDSSSHRQRLYKFRAS